MGNHLLLVTYDAHLINLVHQLNNDYQLGFLVEVQDRNSFLMESREGSRNTLVFLDLDHIPQMELNTPFVQLNKKITFPLVLIKSHYEHQELRSYFKSGVYDCLSKPLDKEHVHQVLLDLKMENSESSGRQTEKYTDDILPSLRVSLIYNLLYGNIRETKEIWTQSQMVGLSSVPNTAMAVQIDEFFALNKNKSKHWQDSIRNDVIIAAREFLNNQLEEALAMGTGMDKFAILLSLPFQADKNDNKLLVKRLAEETKYYIKEQTGYTVTIGIGNYYEDVRNLHVSYEEAMNAQKYKFFGGKDIVIHIDDVEPLSKDVSLLPNKDIVALAKKLKMADMDGIQESKGLLINALINMKVDPDIFKFQISEISATFARAAINGGADSKEIHSILLQYTNDLNIMENINEMKQRLKEMIDNFAHLVFKNNNEYTLKSVQMAMEYIEENFSENITLEDVAGHVHLSSTYLSRLFKNVTGRNFIEYITHLRIEKAKRLLVDLDYTVYQIALEVGYNNSHYFSRVFKATVGKTPSEYRNSMLGPSNMSSELVFY
ncbi:AraC family transcriptional regulator [Siminovitchia acidinfaciens]|uniref:AraC family transcriptional regulator n=1 Tax=Siminovitchia acidinfaciens TaxID=2321395 RepID=A0A429XZL0_9BACI|nr:helix-turn-helix domain-containing protein [Siminovitchia acidinfaciens]RST74244.1 AraC family transcriptional regulator [Siminovitchia acidinfaciens]